jgi:hypothetical protein
MNSFFFLLGNLLYLDVCRGLPSGYNDVLYPVDSLLNPGAVYSMGGPLPPSRVHHTVTVVDRYVIVFGGESTEGILLDDIHLYDTKIRSWSGPLLKLACCNHNRRVIDGLGSNEAAINRLPLLRTGFEGDIPLPRAEHAAAGINGRLYLFGGRTLDGYSHDLYTFDPVELRWAVIDHAIGRPPTRRAGHSVANSDTHFYVFGGRTCNDLNCSLSVRALNDVWSYDAERNEWNQLQATSRASPSPRQEAAIIAMNNRVFIFGGLNPISGIVFNDVWVFDVVSRVWTNLSPNSGSVVGYAPPPLYHAHLIPVQGLDGSNRYSNGDGTYVQGFHVYGGAGGGGSCAGGICKMHETAVGQIYKFEVTLKAFNDGSEGRVLNNGLDSVRSAKAIFKSDVFGNVVYDEIVSSSWVYSRLAKEGLPADDYVSRGKSQKAYVLESVGISADRQLFYEFGGIQPVDPVLVNNNQAARPSASTVQMRLDAGGEIPVEPSDIDSGEALRSSNDIPFSGVWFLKDSFVRSQPQENMTTVAFLNEMRTFRISFIDVVNLYIET